MNHLQRTGSTRASRPVAARRSKAKVLVPIAAGAAVGILALTAALQTGAAGTSAAPAMAIAPSVADLTAAGAQGYDVAPVTGVEGDVSTQGAAAEEPIALPSQTPRGNDLESIVVVTPTPTPTPTPPTTPKESTSQSSGSGSSGGVDPNYVAPSPGTVKAIAAEIVASQGWGDGEFACLDNLYQRESGWNPLAKNPSSGAYGIPQSLPASKMASHGSDYLTNPATQIRWGIDYIKGRYGTPCGAWAHSEAVNWY